MKLSEIKIKDLLALYVVVFGLVALVFFPIPDVILGALTGYVAAILQYFFGSSTGSASKDKIIEGMRQERQPLNVDVKVSDLTADPITPIGNEETGIGGGGIPNPNAPKKQ